MIGQYDVLVTTDRSIEFQQRLSTLPLGIVLVCARSNGMQDLRPLVRLMSAMVVSGRPGVVQKSRVSNEG
jgi:hypothetical protein